MKHKAFFKLTAVLLAVVSVVCLILSGITVFCNLDYGLYTNSPAEIGEGMVTRHSAEYADILVEEYAFRQSGMPREIWENYFGSGYLNWSVWPEVDYRLTENSEGGTAVEDLTSGSDYYYTETIWLERWTGHAVKVGEDYEIYPDYREDGYQNTVPAEATEPTTGDSETVPITVPAEYDGVYDLISTDDGDLYRIYRNKEYSEYTVELFYTEEEYNDVLGQRYSTSALMSMMYELRYSALVVLGISLLVLILMMTYLAYAAGRQPDSDEIRPGGLNRMPLDLYTAVDCFLGFWLVWALLEPVMNAMFDLGRLGNEAFWVLVLSAVGLSAGIGLICILYWTALCAQIKAGDGYWWRNTIIGRFGNTIWSFVARCLRKLLSLITGIGGKMGDKMPSFTDLLRDFNDKLPLMWQWLAASLVMFVMLAVLGSMCRYGFGMFFYAIFVCICLAAIVYGARAFGELRDAAKRMSQGNLDVKINSDKLEGCFRDFAGDLNALSEACIVAAREQLKSERMKTELITNVSHDIKTPLTSIINYVDLLQKAETEEERKEYLEVLERQSARLKKLIEDLMEMSKASSGNVAMELAPTDVVESVNQALGEYADRFEALRLTVLFRKPGESVTAMCDGKLLWRVMSNVMTNVVKYAMPGTRVYLDLTVSEFKVQLSMKNISREELNITADELMERFVRGDESRNTEGNGLGLNIAKSLMEVQGGSLDLVVDGDLFKVVLTLPKAE